MSSLSRSLPALLSTVALAACGPASIGPETVGADDVVDGDIAPPFDIAGEPKEDAVRGVPVSVAGSATEVWAVTQRWSDRDTPKAREAGMAWAANSGLTWEEKFARWVDSLPRLNGEDGRVTFSITTPYGRTLDGPVLECSEVALFLRSTFASWYGLPFFMEATDARGKRIYLGHFGWRTENGKYGGSPDFKTRYRDHTGANLSRGWPSDATLRTKALGDDAREAGKWFDDLYLNKRMGYFQLILLNWFGSMNLADEANAFHLKPEAIRTGDVVVERWQRTGIGHTLIVKSVQPEGEQLAVTLASGSMPRRQPLWENEVDSKRYFTSEVAGGPGQTYDGDEYARLGGGLRRFRQAIQKNGRWFNAVPATDSDVVIWASNVEAVAARTARFEQLLAEPSPATKRDALLASLETKRAHLRKHPASCSARMVREEIFDELKTLMVDSFGMTAAQVDAQYRKLEDYVFGELTYAQSKTCCWNSTTAEMYGIVMDFEEDRQQRAGQCLEPLVFKSRTDGYKTWRDFAVATGRGAQWKEWSEDEPCQQRNVAEDAEAGQEATGYCRLGAGGGGGGSGACTDALEPNDAGPVSIQPGTLRDLRICAGDVDRFYVDVSPDREVSATLRFRSASGDLDLRLRRSDGTQVAASEGTGDTEIVSHPGPGRFIVEVVGYSGAQNGYELDVAVR